MSTPRFYSWDDDGSPGRALSGNLQNRLKQILVPCLVTGYGSKPGAGWTLEHEHANGFTLSNGQNYINFVSNLPAQSNYPPMSSYGIHIYIAESLTDTSGAVINGLNLSSGSFTAGAPETSGYPRHGFRGGNTLSDNLGSLQWVVVADDKTFYLYAFSSGNTASNGYPINIYIGEYINNIGIGSTIALGGDLGPYNDYYNSYTFAVGFTATRNQLTGLAGNSYFSALPYNAASANVLPSVGLPGTSPANLYFRQPLLYQNGLAGPLRGVVYDNILLGYNWQTNVKALGFSGADSGQRGVVATIDGYKYAYSHSMGGGCFMTDNPAFW